MKLFNFADFKNQLLENDEKEHIVDKYEKHYGALSDDFRDTFAYKAYVSKFKIAPEQIKLINIPEELQDEFDWELLFQLVFASFSSMCDFVLSKDGKIELQISVQSGEQSITKTLGELWSFQILRLYYIYVEEQMNLFILIKEEENEAEAIQGQQMLRFERFKLMMKTKFATLEEVKKSDDIIEF